jgi:hypothetical protein
MMVEFWMGKGEMGDDDLIKMEVMSGYEKPGVPFSPFRFEDQAGVK